MHENHKLNEALYFYSRMLSEADNRDNFLYDLSAYLSSARSVLQYALEEARAKSGGQAWYDRQISSNKIVSFFRDKRDINIHVQPIEMNRIVSIEITETIHVSENIHIEKFDESGRLIGESSSKSEPFVKETETPASVTNIFTFQDWAGSENVIQLCELYLKELERIVADGQTNGFLMTN